jgi:hypothetical protein
MQFHSSADNLLPLNTAEKSQEADLVKKGRVG